MEAEYFVDLTGYAEADIASMRDLVWDGLQKRVPQEIDQQQALVLYVGWLKGALREADANITDGFQA